MAVSNVVQYIRGSFRCAQVSLLDDAGFPVGLTGALANGADTGLTRLRGARTATLNVPQARSFNVPGDGESQGRLQIPPGDSMEYELTLSVANMTYQSATQQTSAYAIGKWTGQILDPISAVYPDQMHVYSRPARDKATSAPGYENIFVFKAQASYSGPGELDDGESPGEDKYNVSVTKSTKYPWLVALADANEGTTAASGDVFWSEYPMTIHSFKGDNADTTVTLTETPAGDDTTSYVKVWKDGVLLTATTAYTVNTSTKVVTFAVAPAAGTKVAIVYEATTLP